MLVTLFKKILAFKHTNLIFRIILIGLLLALLYVELTGRKNLAQTWTTFKGQLDKASFGYLVIVMLLQPANWLAETLKWRLIMGRVVPLSMWQSLKAVMGGVSIAIFTPGRIGEYGGRLLFVPREFHWHALMSNFIGNVAQFLVLLCLGIIGGAWFFIQMNLVQKEWVGWLLILAVLFVAILFWVFFNQRLFWQMLKRFQLFRYFRSYVRDITVLTQTTKKMLALALLWSAMRYAIYTTQYVMMAYYFQINAGLLAAYSAVASIFLLQTLAPLPAVASLLVRGNLAVWVWSFFGANEISSLAASFFIWIINLIFPALLGTFFMFNVRITKTLGYDDK